MSSPRPSILARTPAQHEQLRLLFRQRLATCHRPRLDGGGFGTLAREISHWRTEYEHMPLLEFWHCVRRDGGDYYYLRQSGPERFFKTPTLLGRDVLPAARIWREERRRWVAQWLAEAQQLGGLAELPPAFPVGDPHATAAVYGHVVPGIPRAWLEAPWEWPDLGGEWSRQTPGVFEVWAHDLDELRRRPHNLDGVGSCEPEEFAVMHLPDLAALSRILLALVDHYGPDSLLTRSRVVERAGEFFTLIAVDCRSWLRTEGEEVTSD